jgi:sulfhydrogenase subunit beta (sulfur reductase)
MPYLTIQIADLPKVAASLASNGKRIILPVREGKEIFYRVGAAPFEADISGLPKNSIKEFLFPKSERILTYQYKDSEVSLGDITQEGKETVVFCARPCDAASLPVVEPLWNWDYKDGFFNERRLRTVMVTLACKTAPDEACFCVSVGLAPHSDQGSDVILYPIDGERLACRFVTPAGEALKGMFAPYGKGDAGDEEVEATKKSGEASLAGKKHLGKVKEWLDAHFEDPLWEEKAFQCIGCGTCTFLCPTCHCFDIQDEAAFDAGYRMKNWDACQFSLFTVHTSGHNPRDTQPKRYRQRIYHKYAIYPEKFGKVLCTGCGRCVAYCPVNLSLYDVVATAQERAEKGA